MLSLGVNVIAFDGTNKSLSVWRIREHDEHDTHPEHTKTTENEENRRPTTVEPVETQVAAREKRHDISDHTARVRHAN